MDARYSDIGAGIGPARTLLACVLAGALVAGGIPLAAIPGLAFADDDSVGLAAGSTFAGSDGLTYTVVQAATGTGASGAGYVSISDDDGWEGTQLVVDDTLLSASDASGVTCFYKVVSIGSHAFEGNDTLTSVTIEADFETDYVASLDTIQTYAFANCTALTTVDMPAYTRDIASYAFYNCTSLVAVNFPDGATVTENTSLNSPAIENYAFGNCTALQSFTVPALASAVRKADYYYSYDEFNPDTDYTTTDSVFYSGYDGYWHNQYAAVARSGLSTTAFSGCTSLASVVFAAGESANGSFAALALGGFVGCDALETIVFENAQAYCYDPNGSMQNATFTDSLDTDDDGEADICLYYAVDYYATQDDAEADDDAGSQRLARVEYERSTSTDAIAAGDADALAECTYAGYDDVPDPDAVAAQLGYDTSVQWLWKLTGSQSQREGLTDSCQAYLVQANELSAGRFASETVTALQRRCDQNLSRWIVDGQEQDSTFDAYRFTSADSYNFTSQDPVTGEAGDDYYLFIGSEGEDDFLAQIGLVDGLGRALDTSEVTLSYQRYELDATTGEGSLLEAESFKAALNNLGDEGGPLLVTVEPAEGSSYTGQLQVWVLVKSNVGSVLARYTQSPSGTASHLQTAANGAPTWFYATRMSEVSGSYSSVYSSPYSVLVDYDDLSSALVAMAYAGLADAPVVVDESGQDDYGFYLGTEYNAGYGALTSTSTSDGVLFPATNYADDAAGFAVACYEAFAKTTASSPRVKLGVSDTSAYAWGTTALLVDTSVLSNVSASVAAYAYAASAPVFYLEADGTVGSDTLSCLDDFEHVVLFGSETAFGETAVAELADALEGATVDDALVSYVHNASQLSRATADALMEAGLASAETVTISDSEDPFDAIGALNRSGYYGGITLVSSGSADSKATSRYLRTMRDDVSTVRLFGRMDGNVLSEPFDLVESLYDLWDEDGYAAPELEVGDTIEYDGCRLLLISGSGTADDPFTFALDEVLWGGEEPSSGSYSFAVDCGDGASALVACDYAVDAMEGVTVTLAQSSYTYDGTEHEPAVTVTDAQGATLVEGFSYALSYRDNVDAGTAYAVVTGIGTYTGTLEAAFTIEPRSITAAALVKTGYTYSGAAKEPKATVRADDVTLVAGTDYTLSYRANVNAGTAYAVVKGAGNYTGTFTLSFTIARARIASVKLSSASFAYSGTKKKPSVKVKGAGGTLSKGTDYRVTYAGGRKAIGSYKVTVKGTGNYKGTIVKRFSIVPAKVTVKSVRAGASGSKKLTVRWKRSSGGVTGYQVRYRLKGSSKWRVATVGSKACAKALSKLKRGKRYQVQVRACKRVGSTTYRGAWSKVKVAKVK